MIHALQAGLTLAAALVLWTNDGYDKSPQKGGNLKVHNMGEIWRPAGNQQVQDERIENGLYSEKLTVKAGFHFRNPVLFFG